MKGLYKILSLFVMLALIFSSTLTNLRIEPDPISSDDTESVPNNFLLPPIKDFRDPNEIRKDQIPNTYRHNISNMSREEYIEKWYGDEVGFNKSLAFSCERLTFEGHKGSAAFSPDGKKIIYTSKEDGGDYFDIWIMDIDGTNRTQVTFCDYGESQPSFMSDGIHIMYVTSGKLGIRVWIKNLINNSTTYYDLRGCHPSPAPGNRIIFSSNCTQIADMYFENYTYLPVGMGGNWPHMDASGTLIVSEGYHCNQYNQLLLADLVNNTSLQLTFDEINHNDPSISPDGKMIVYDTYYSPPARDYSNLWLYDIITGKQYQLTYGMVVDGMAEFSPSGKQIIFGSTRGNEGWSFDLWLITLEMGY